MLGQLLTGCATVGDSGSDNDLCSSFLFAIVAIPCAAAFGVGCVVGAGSRCCGDDGNSDEEPAPAAAVRPEVAPGQEESHVVAW